MSTEQLGRLMVGIGLGLALFGGLVWAIGAFLPSLRLGRLPGDIAVERPGFSLYIPITTMILASILLTGALWLVGQIRK